MQDLRGVFDAVSAQLRALPRRRRGAARDCAALEARGGARPADRGRGARGEEPAQRDDHPPRAAAPEAGQAARRPPTCARTPTSSATEIERLDAVVQGFLKFARPEDMRSNGSALGGAGRRRGADDAARGGGGHVASRCVSRRPVAARRRRPDDAAPGAVQPGRQRRAGDAARRRLRSQCEAGRDGRVEMRVRDTGVGIPAEQLARIFDLYFTTKPKGSGIGLSMVFRTVQLHHGDIDVESAPGRRHDVHHLAAARG